MFWDSLLILLNKTNSSSAGAEQYASIFYFMDFCFFQCIFSEFSLVLLFQLLETETDLAIFSFFSRGRHPELSSSRTPSPGVPLLCCSRHEGNGLHCDFFSGSRVPSNLLTPTLGNCLFGTKWELNCADPRTCWGSHPPPEPAEAGVRV